MMQQTYPPRGMERQNDLVLAGPKPLKIESYLRRRNGTLDWLLTDESVWLITPTTKLALPTPKLVAENPFPLDRFTISPNGDFIFGARKVCTGESETVNAWIVRRRGKAHRGGPISYLHLVRWLAGGNGGGLAGLYSTGKHNY